MHFKRPKFSVLASLLFFTCKLENLSKVIKIGTGEDCAYQTHFHYLFFQNQN